MKKKTVCKMIVPQQSIRKVLVNAALLVSYMLVLPVKRVHTKPKISEDD